MDAGFQLPACTLRLIGVDFNIPIMQSVIDELWQLKQTNISIHRHHGLTPIESVNRDEVWILSPDITDNMSPVSRKPLNWPCAGLFLHERSSQKPLPDLRPFAAADWIFDPWAPGELLLRLRALIQRMTQYPAPTDNAFFKAGTESAHVPMQKAKSDVVSAFERGYLLSLLQSHSGNVSAAARAANKHRRAFFALLRKHRIEPEAFREVEDRSEIIAKGFEAKSRISSRFTKKSPPPFP